MIIQENCIFIRFDSGEFLRLTNVRYINIKEEEIEVQLTVKDNDRKYLVDRSKVRFYEVWCEPAA